MRKAVTSLCRALSFTFSATLPFLFEPGLECAWYSRVSVCLWLIFTKNPRSLLLGWRAWYCSLEVLDFLMFVVALLYYRFFVFFFPSRIKKPSLGTQMRKKWKRALNQKSRRTLKGKMRKAQRVKNQRLTTHQQMRTSSPKQVGETARKGDRELECCLYFIYYPMLFYTVKLKVSKLNSFLLVSLFF